MDNTTLIQSLARECSPVRPLACPLTRTALWFAVVVPYIALVVFVATPRSDLAAMTHDWRFVIEQAAALATAATAAFAAFASTVPGYDRRLLFLPLAPVAVWLVALGQGCMLEWLSHGLQGLWLHSDWFSIRSVLIVGALPAVAMAVMLRRGAPLYPHLTAAFGGLAAAGLGNFGLRLFHPVDASLMVLVWQVGTVVAVSALAGWAGRYLFNWRSTLCATCGKAATR